MSSGVIRHGDREITRGLVESLRPALGPDAKPVARLAARDVANLLGLPGLEAALRMCDMHVGDQRPREVMHLAERIARVADAAEVEGSLAVFMAVDDELRSIATHIEHVEWEAPTSSVPTASYPVLDQLLGLTLDGAAGLESARFSAPVAAAVRAALDWLGVDESSRTTVQLEDSALELSVRVELEGGLAPAGAVLATVEGGLGHGDDGRWVIRVPLANVRASFLLMRQGHLGVALPWHAVARLRMLREGERDALSEPVLAPLSVAFEATGERPAALLSRGLRRAWLIADRIVWRVTAEPEEALTASPVPGVSRVVRVEGNQDYWITDVEALLREVEPMEVPAPAPRPRSPVLMEVAAEPEDPFALLDDLLPALGPDSPPVPPGFTPTVEIVHPEEPMVPQVASAAPPPTIAPAPRPAPIVLSEADVSPLHAARVRPRRALVVDDSLVARIFLSRLLEQRGFPVVQAENAAELWAELDAQPFGVVFVDVCLPDARGRAHLERMLDLRTRSREPFAVVVLTRDHADEEVARAAGALLTLRKPFESTALDHLLLQLPRHPEDPR